MSHRSAFEPWEHTWTPESVTRFWDWHVDNVHFEPLFFSKRYGDAILEEISHRIPLSGPVVDFGCGPGYLVEKLLQRRVDTIGIDSAPQAVAKLTERCQGKPHFLGARTAADGMIPLEDGVAEILLMVEVIEHLDDDALTSVLGEVRRVVRLGGHVVCTTPNEENLECPVPYWCRHFRASSVGYHDGSCA